MARRDHLGPAAKGSLPPKCRPSPECPRRSQLPFAGGNFAKCTVSDQEMGGKVAFDTIRLGNSIGMKLREDIMKAEPFSVLTRFATMEELTGN